MHPVHVQNIPKLFVFVYVPYSGQRNWRKEGATRKWMDIYILIYINIYGNCWFTVSDLLDTTEARWFCDHSVNIRDLKDRQPAASWESHLVGESLQVRGSCVIVSGFWTGWQPCSLMFFVLIVWFFVRSYFTLKQPTCFSCIEASNQPYMFFYVGFLDDHHRGWDPHMKFGAKSAVAELLPSLMPFVEGLFLEFHLGLGGSVFRFWSSSQIFTSNSMAMAMAGVLAGQPSCVPSGNLT